MRIDNTTEYRQCNISDLVIGRDDTTYVVREMSYPHKLIELLNVDRGNVDIYSFDDFEYLVETGMLAVAARQADLWRWQPIVLPSPLGTSLDRVVYYCQAVDRADPRFVFTRSAFEIVATDAAAIIGDYPPSPDRVKLWWRAWVLADRQRERFAITLGALIGGGLRYDA